MTDVFNRQKNIQIKTREFALFVDKVVSAIHEAHNKKPEVSFVDDEEMKSLNLEFRKVDSTTDVLSFRYLDEEFEESESLGDIVISVEQAKQQSFENGIDLRTRIAAASFARDSSSLRLRSRNRRW